MRTRGAIGTACVAATLAGSAAPVRAQATDSAVRITVTVGADASARVLENYRIPPDTARRVFRMLTRPCAVPGDIRLGTSGGSDAGVALERREQGPWVELLHVDSADNRDSPGFEVRYGMRLSGASVDIPLVHLARPIPRAAGDRAGSVSVAVDLSATPGASVTFPVFERHGSGVWRARFVAIPSFVHVELPGAAAFAPCDTDRAAPRDDGGLTWRFWLFAGIMAAWVPLYLAWARRSGEPGA